MALHSVDRSSKTADRGSDKAALRNVRVRRGTPAHGGSLTPRRYGDLLLLALLVLVSGACSDAVERDLTEASSALATAVLTEGSGRSVVGTGDVQLSDPDPGDDDASFIAAADRFTSDVSQRLGIEQPKRDDFTARLVKLARQRAAESESARAESSLASLIADGATESDLQTRVREVEALIQEVSTRYATAEMEQSITRQLEQEARFVVLATDLRSATTGPVPEDPLALASEVDLRNALDALKARARYYSEKEALVSSPEYSQILGFFKRQAERIETVLSSAERTAFLAKKDALLEGIDDPKWKALQASRPWREMQAQQRLKREAEALELFRAIQIVTNPIRGPPADALENAIQASIRNYDVDVGGWARATAQLQAVAAELGFIPSAGDSALTDKDWKRRVLTIADDTTLSRVHRILTTLRAAYAARTVPDSLSDRVATLQEWNTALDFALADRKEGVALPTTAIPEVSRARVRHLDSGSDSVSPRSAAMLLAVLQIRFSRPEVMPPRLRQETAVILSESLSSYAQTVAEIVQRYTSASDKLARSTKSVDVDAHDLRSELRSVLGSALTALAAYEERASRFGAELAAEDRRTLEIARLLFPRGPPKEGPRFSESGSGGRRPEPPPVPSGLTLSTDPRLENRIAIAETLAFQLEDKADQVSTGPVEFAAAKGRRTIRETAFNARRVNWASARYEPQKTRLPERLVSWVGRLRNDGKPFNYARDVRNFRSFEAVGGGVHLGDIGTLGEARNLSSFVLIYDSALGQLALKGPDGSTFTLAGIPPEVLKPLLRFAESGRNAAVSIGWGMERTNVDERLNQLREGSPVLLDPFLVDTRVGQDLVLADSIAWDLGEPRLPNGAPIAFSSDFTGALDRFLVGQIAPFRQVLDGVESFSAVGAQIWDEELASHGAPLVLRSLLVAKSMDEVEGTLLTLFILDSLAEAGLTIKKGDTVATAVARLEMWKLASQHMGFYPDPDDEDVIEYVKRMAEKNPRVLLDLKTNISKRVKGLKKEMREALAPQIELLGELGPDIREARTQVASLIVRSALDDGEADTYLVELWASLLMDEHPDWEEADLASSLLRVLNPTTLAVLIDEPTTIHLVDDPAGGTGRIILDGTMKYRYATQNIQLDDNKISLVVSSKDEGSEAVTIEGLTEIANTHFDELVSAYPPLSRVVEYARLSALMRWAVVARSEGQLGAIDLGDLGSTPANDRSRYPTPDAVLRGR